MAARFELVLDSAGRFHFQLRGADGGVLLRSAAARSKIMAQHGVLHARSALRDPARVVPWQAANGAPRVVVTRADGSVLARSPELPDASAIHAVAARIRDAGDRAPIIDLTKHHPAATEH
jgi:uncharacterized protein YegP (UPF0339 family)